TFQLIHISIYMAILSASQKLNSSIYTLFPYTTLFRSTQKSGGGFLFIKGKMIGRYNFHNEKSLRITKKIDKVLSNSNFVRIAWRSEEHTSELQSRFDLVCRLLLEKKKNKKEQDITTIR